MNILLADHHPIFRYGIIRLMEDHNNFRVISFVDDGKDLVKAIKDNEIDLLLLEIDLPNTNGIATLRDLKSQFPHLKTFILSCHPAEIYSHNAMKSGAVGYLAKTRSVDDIKKAILSVIEGNTYFATTNKVIPSPGRDLQKQRFKKLSSREIEVLNLLSAGKRNKEIASDLSLNEKTVSTYKTRLLKKLNAESITELILQARLLQLTQ